MCTLLGIALPLQLVLSACNDQDDNSSIHRDDLEFTGKVLIIEAGPAGMTTGYLLAQQGVDFLE